MSMLRGGDGNRNVTGPGGSRNNRNQKDTRSEEERDLEAEREAARRIYEEKEVLLQQAKQAFKDGGHRGPGNILEQLQGENEMEKQEMDLARLEEAAIRQQKMLRRREAKRKAEAEQKWMVFSNVDAFDEGELTKLTAFMETVVKYVPKMGDSQWADKETDRGGMNVIEEYLALKVGRTTADPSLAPPCRCCHNTLLSHHPRRNTPLLPPWCRRRARCS